MLLGCGASNASELTGAPMTLAEPQEPRTSARAHSSRARPSLRLQCPPTWYLCR